MPTIDPLPYQSSLPLVFSGWEPHSVVWWTRHIVQNGAPRPRARVVGREPVTSTAIFLDGVIVEERHDLYDRGYTLRSHAGNDFKVGGTNTTSSIAALVTVLEVPRQLLPVVPADAEDLILLLDQLFETDESLIASTCLLQLEYSLRLKRMATLLERTLLTYMPQARPLVVEATGLVGLEALELDSFVERSGDACERAIDAMPEVAADAARVMSLLGDRRSLQVLVQKCASSDPKVSAASALALRAFEFEFQACQVASPMLAQSFLEALASAVLESSDPETRVYLAEDLGYLNPGAPPVLSALSRLLADDEHTHVRWAASVALGRALAPGAAISDLARAIDQPDCHIRVRRASLISLGRLFHRASLDLTGADLAAVDLPEVAQIMNGCLSDPDSTTIAYALFALGELPRLHNDVLDRITGLLEAGSSYVVAAHAILALYKHDVRSGLSDGLRSRLAEVVPTLLAMPFDHGHPGASYHEWFVLTAWRLLTRLEEAESAARFASEACRVLASNPSRADYFRGLADLQLGEHLLAGKAPRTSAAIQAFERASRGFHAVAARARFADESLSDVSALSAVTRAAWAKTRADFLTHLEDLEQAAFAQRGAAGREDHSLGDVRNDLESILASRPLVTTEAGPMLPMAMTRPASTEAALLWFRDASYLVDELSELQIALATDEPAERLLRLRARIRSTLNRMRQRLEAASSRQIAEAQENLDEIASMYFSADVSGDPYEGSADGLTHSITALRTPLPVPDVEHQLVGKGRASFKLYLKDLQSARGRNVIGDQLELLSSERLSIRAVVSVDLVSDDEVLVLQWRYGDEAGNHVIKMHEGLESVEIQVDPEDATAEYEMVVALTLTTAGYSEIIQEQTIQVAWQAPNRVTPEEGVAQLKRLVSEQESIRRDLDLYYARGGGDSVEQLHAREADLARIGRIVTAMTSSIERAGGSLEIHLRRPPVRQKNGYLLVFDPTQEALLTLALQIAQETAKHPLPRPEVLERGPEIEVLMSSETYDAVFHHLQVDGAA